MRVILKIALVVLAATTLHACGENSSDDKVSGISLSTVSKDNQQASQNAGDTAGSSKPFPHLDPVMPSMDNLSGKAQDYPKVWPVPQFPGAKVQLVRIEYNQRPGTKNQVELKAPTTPYMGELYYQNLLVKDGWKKTDGYINNVFGRTTWQKDGQEISVVISPNPHGENNIQLFWGPAPRPLRKTALAPPPNSAPDR